jgi:glycosyltransferase involved in cell wall biosynthesis
VRGIVVNVRTLRTHATGVQRYTQEVVSRLRDDVEPIAPGGAVHGMQGHLWEQTVLPARLGGRLLWSPANTGPWWVDRQVVTVHDAAPLDHPEWFASKFARWYGFVLPRLLSSARRIITVSEFSRVRLVDHAAAVATRIDVIPLGIGHEFRPVDDSAVAELRRRRRLPDDYVLAVGSLQPRKNLARLLVAWERLRPRFPDTLLVVAGARFDDIFGSAGFDRLPRRVLLLGYVDDAELPALYTGARALVHPSLYEGFGLPLLEAMACGTPVVTSAGSAMAELADGAAELVDPRDPASIAEGIERAIARRDELRTAGFERARAFTWDAAADATAAVYQELV